MDYAFRSDAAGEYVLRIPLWVAKVSAHGNSLSMVEIRKGAQDDYIIRERLNFVDRLVLWSLTCDHELNISSRGVCSNVEPPWWTLEASHPYFMALMAHGEIGKCLSCFFSNKTR